MLGRGRAARSRVAHQIGLVMERILEVSKLSKTYATPQGPLTVLRSVDLTLDRGETVALLGESGSGKSTLLHLIAGLDAADAGDVRLEGWSTLAGGDAARARARREKIGLVFQQFNLIPSVDVRANIEFQARLVDRLDCNWIDQLIERLGLGMALDRYPEQLSGGQQQRVAIGRALAARPALVLADEPTGALDEETGDRALEVMTTLAREARSALLVATHSARVAARLDRRLRIERGALLDAIA